MVAKLLLLPAFDTNVSFALITIFALPAKQRETWFILPIMPYSKFRFLKAPVWGVAVDVVGEVLDVTVGEEDFHSLGGLVDPMVSKVCKACWARFPLIPCSKCLEVFKEDVLLNAQNAKDNEDALPTELNADDKVVHKQVTAVANRLFAKSLAKSQLHPLLNHPLLLPSLLQPRLHLHQPCLWQLQLLLRSSKSLPNHPKQLSTLCK